MTATVSVVIPVRDGADLLPDALASIAAQSVPVLETIVVADDAPSVAVAEAAGCRVLPQDGPGLADAYNTGVLAARGTHLSFLAHDDVWTPDKVERQLEVLAEEPAADAVIGMTRFELADGALAPPGFRTELLEGVHRTPIPEALLVPRTTFDRVGLFRREVASASDVDWFARFSDLGLTLVTADSVVLVKRITTTSTSHVAPGATAGLLRALRESVERKRASP